MSLSVITMNRHTQSQQNHRLDHSLEHIRSIYLLRLLYNLYYLVVSKIVPFNRNRRKFVNLKLPTVHIVRTISIVQILSIFNITLLISAPDGSEAANDFKMIQP